jgi:hypothetical protein
VTDHDWPYFLLNYLLSVDLNLTEVMFPNEVHPGGEE